MALSEDKELLIEAYKEQAAAFRHHDQLFYNFAAIILPFSFVLLGVPYIHSKIPPWLPLFGGAILMIFLCIFFKITERKVDIHFQLIHTIEANLGMMHGHKEWEKIRKGYRQICTENGCVKNLPMRRIIRYMFPAYFLILVCVFVHKHLT